MQSKGAFNQYVFNRQSDTPPGLNEAQPIQDNQMIGNMYQRGYNQQMISQNYQNGSTQGSTIGATQEIRHNQPFKNFNCNQQIQFTQEHNPQMKINSIFSGQKNPYLQDQPSIFNEQFKNQRAMSLIPQNNFMPPPGLAHIIKENSFQQIAQPQFEIQRAYSLGNIYEEQQKSFQFKTCAVCIQEITLVDDYTITFHPALKQYCPTHKNCLRLLRRDSGLVAVPKFELKVTDELQPSTDVYQNTPKFIEIAIEILHPMSKQLIHSIDSSLVQSLPVSINTQKLENIEVQILFKVIWTKQNNAKLPRIIQGMIDLQQYMQEGKLSQNIQVQLDQPEEATVELQFKVLNQQNYEGQKQMLTIKDISLILEVKEVQEFSTTSSSYMGLSRGSIDINNIQQQQNMQAWLMFNRQMEKRQYSLANDAHLQNFQNQTLQQQQQQQINQQILYAKKKANSIVDPNTISRAQFSPQVIPEINSSPILANPEFRATNFNTLSQDFIPQNRSSPVQGQIMTSQISEEINQGFFRDGEIFSKILTKQGSKEMQKNLDKANPLTVEKIVQEIEQKFAEILIDQYGNYFCQKLFLKINDQQKHRLLQTLKEPFSNTKNKFLGVAKDSRGTHSLQGFLESINKSQFNQIVGEILHKDLLKYAYNKHATHVLIRFIQLADVHPHLEKIYEVICKNMISLSQDANGLPVIKATIKKFNVPEIKHRMINILSNEYWSNEDCQTMYKGFIPQLQQLSIQKFSSNVIEKVLDKADQVLFLFLQFQQPTVEMYAQEIIEGDKLRILIRNNYGYYVVERILMHCLSEQLNQKLRQEILKNVNTLGGNQLRNKWLDLIEKSKSGLFFERKVQNLRDKGENRQ
ncbi:pumillio protein 3 [Stylonychia lemnae]|uniref:Pumillio protein 3 n=1 Tax=Stylonychia lemnae TaxID=5949 RepID=A0A078ALC9_STYLE|nr:pumillio protein 3 [Stylonychia lemnae]|eukprot:CDW82681.1 pumillio protein 3 [Stylonychia lemnae]